MPVIKKHAPGDVLDMRRGFDENGLYGNLAWLAENQGKIEQKLFESRRGEKKPKLFCMICLRTTHRQVRLW
ncbi:MAG: hypothetical protein A3K25_02120 [Planctomycetes bacterium RIFOXYB12_FULL_42_10]|nr:MAG: hypothetical protein A2069_06730 [Planctomycetes bacterium GWB2_41_19]OHB44813.1 MAG: hypothetical protein A2094_03545 [Planctomycetes bacterium GWE2_41_14]OHC05973.1 MAG: hypothetical protein A3J92_00065 [Planctomycetes bacterium RIFOXYC2_FULL_41_27]OHC07279.1 MAG: hypothetical protein A2545_00180 [Planctomycetes bacterium RIFOXYD2_FULL_41_16]OHC18589.1 MAG: hypothetical protein A3K25_02120 [Planctomycetes bacterium RIFOXYB12_FULL_42_10]